MSHFIKKSLEELEHVVWPTKSESQRYMLYTVGTIIITATLLAVVGYFISTGLAGVRQMFDHPNPIMTQSGADSVTQAELDKLIEQFGTGQGVLSGASVEIGTSSGTPATVEVTPVAPN
jgi:preprotein translocase SecE subunit